MKPVVKLTLLVAPRMTRAAILPRVIVALSAAALAMLTAACADDGPTVPATPATRLSISWANCPNQIDNIAWLAVQEGTGPWRQVIPSAEMFTFTVDSARAGVVYVNPGYVAATTWVRFYTAAELQATTPVCYSQPAPAGATIFGTAALQGFESAEIALAGSGAYASAGGPGVPSFTLEGVSGGGADLVSARSSNCQGPSSCNVATSMIIRRNIEPGDRSTLAVLDFSDAREAFQLVPRLVTLDGMSAGSSFIVEGEFSTARTSRSVTLMRSTTGTATAASMKVPYYGVPIERLATGDIHHLFASTSSGGDRREGLVDVTGAGDASMTFGPVLPAVTIAASRRPGFATFSVRLSPEGAFKAWIAEFVQVNADVLVRASAEYVRGGDVVLSIPDLASVSGWLPSWGLQAGLATNWDVVGLNLDATTLEHVRCCVLPPYQASSRFGKITP